MEDYPQHRENSAGIGSARRPVKRPRTDISRDGSPGTGPSSASAAANRTAPAFGDSSINTVTVPGTILLPNRDSQGRRTVIDLTDDDPPPRRQPEIIDVDALPDRPSSYFNDVNYGTDNDDYQLLMSRRRHPRPSGLAPPARPVEPSLNQHYNNRPYMPRYHQEIANPILGHGSRSVNELGSHRHINTVESGGGSGGGGARANFFQFLGGMLGNTGFGFSIQGRGTIQMNDMAFHPPGQLDYRLGMNGILPETPPVEDPVRRREAEYKAPQPPREGFTRSPTSGDCLVCPSCEHELGTHSEEDGQATVWLGKCGHVYCGKCAVKFRSIHPRAKRHRGGPSGQCEVDGCHQSLKGKGLWEVFL